MTKISDYPVLVTPAADDVLPIVDVSDTSMAPSGTTKQVTVADLAGTSGGGGGVSLAGDLGGTSSAPQVISTHLGTALPITQGGTGAGSAGSALTSLGAASASALATETVRAETAEALLAPAASPVFTGTPAAPTQAPLTPGTVLATTAYADSAVRVEAGRAMAAEALALPQAGGTVTGPVILAGNPVTGLQAAPKQYVDAIAQGLSVKPAVQEATTAPLPANTYAAGVLTATAAGVLTVDGVTVALGDRVLVKNEAAAAGNGIYTVTTLGTVSVPYQLTRAADVATGSQVPSAFTFCQQGTVNVAAGFVVSGAGPFTIGTTPIVWTQFSSAGTVVAGTGLSQAGSTVSLTVPVPVADGGTGATTTAAALTSLGAASASALAAETARAEAAQALALPLTGGTMSGPVAMGGSKVTGLANGSGAQDAAAFGQIPTALPPSGAASGDLSGTYPAPVVAKIQGTAISTPPGGSTQFLRGDGTWTVPGGGGTVTGVTAADTSITVAGTGAAPTLATATLDVIATVHPPAAAVPLNSQKLTAVANGVAYTDAATLGQLTSAPGPADVGLVAWSMDPFTAVGTYLLVTGGSAYGMALWVRRNVTITTMTVVVTTGGGTLTASSSWGLLYNSAGTLIGQTADQSTAWATSGVKAMTLTAVTSLALTPGMYWAAVVSTASAGALPTFRATSSGVATAAGTNFGNGGTLAAASSRFGVLATGVTTAPGNITPASITQANGQPMLTGIY